LARCLDRNGSVQTNSTLSNEVLSLLARSGQPTVNQLSVEASAGHVEVR
jgi:hypothetical protein